jgi:hypothetical protein
VSHLSILPTVLRDEAHLLAALDDLGLVAERGGHLQGFAADQQAVTLRVRLPEGGHLGWSRSPDGNLALVADLQQLSRSRTLQPLIGRITRQYAARLALAQAHEQVPGATVHASHAPVALKA